MITEGVAPVSAKDLKKGDWIIHTKTGKKGTVISARDLYVAVRYDDRSSESVYWFNLRITKAVD